MFLERNVHGCIHHKSGYYHVPLHESAWMYFGVQWNNEVYCFSTLSFEWSPSAYMYCLLTNAVWSFLRTVTASPIINRVDNTATGTSIMFKNNTSTEQFHSANSTAFATDAILFWQDISWTFQSQSSCPKSNRIPGHEGWFRQSYVFVLSGFYPSRKCWSQIT